jgi:hypothetical protein
MLRCDIWMSAGFDTPQWSAGVPGQLILRGAFLVPTCASCAAPMPAAGRFGLPPAQGAGGGAGAGGAGGTAGTGAGASSAAGGTLSPGSGAGGSTNPSGTPSSSNGAAVGQGPGTNPNNLQDQTNRSNPQDLSKPGGNNPQDLQR